MTNAKLSGGSTLRAHVWTRALSRNQFEKIRRVERMRRNLARDVAKATMFARCQILDTHCRYQVHHSFSGYWEGEPVTFDVTLRPLFLDYAARLYEAAAREALAHFPSFTEHLVEDGPKLGERQITFTSEKHELALSYMQDRFRSLAKVEEIKVKESIRVDPDPHRPVVDGRRYLMLHLSLDRPISDKAISMEVEAQMSRGELFPLDPNPRKYDLELATETLTEMSLPELAYMNWGRIRKPLTPADKALFKATETFDPNVIAAALAEGADPNAINKGGDTPLAELAQNEHWMDAARANCEKEDELRARIPPVSPAERISCMETLHRAGANLDLFGPNGLTPLVHAVLAKQVATVEWLLRMGADDTIDCFDDSSAFDGPTAWDYAETDASIERTEIAQQTLHALQRLRPTPHG